jgi:hypothetical protein
MDEKVSGKELKNPVKKLLTIDPATRDFTANGRKYIVENAISFQRWNEYQKLQVELGYSITFKELFEKLGEAYELLNSQKFADSAVCIRGIMKGISDIDAKETPSALKLCALFINEENEDRRYINEDMINRKVDDWEKEGIDMNSFFQLALHILPGFLSTLKSISPDTLK